MQARAATLAPCSFWRSKMSTVEDPRSLCAGIADAIQRHAAGHGTICELVIGYGLILAVIWTPTAAAAMALLGRDGLVRCLDHRGLIPRLESDGLLDRRILAFVLGRWRRAAAGGIGDVACQQPAHAASSRRRCRMGPRIWRLHGLVARCSSFCCRATFCMRLLRLVPSATFAASHRRQASLRWRICPTRS